MSAGKPFIIGLTGQTGAGKTTVSQVMLLHGFYHINCDRLTALVLKDGSESARDIGRQFPDFFMNGVFDRRKAAAALFSDSGLLARYNAAIFPHINKLISEMIGAAYAEGHGLILLDAPTLFEAGADKLCDAVISCVAPEKQRIMRIMERDNISEQAARARTAAQHDEQFFRAHSDYVIENGGAVSDAEKAAAETAELIKKRFEIKT